MKEPNLYSFFDEYYVYYGDYLKEIERLTELCNKYEEEHKTTFEKWKKDIQVLNELEKWLEEEIEHWGNITHIYDHLYDRDIQTYKRTLDKLQELKGSDK